MSFFVILFILSILIWGPWFWRYRIRPYLESRQFYQKFRYHPDSKMIAATERFLKELYDNTPGFAISQQERTRLEIQDSAFTYGEVVFLTFLSVLEQTKPKTGEVFYDLGCGTGKAIFTAALFFNFSKVCGIEYLPAMCATAKHQIEKARNMIQTHPNNFSETWLRRIETIQFIEQDFTKIDFSDADIIFANATCFDEIFWKGLVEKFAQLKIGSRIIMTTKRIEHEKFQLLEDKLVLMSWGMNSIRIYVKIK